ncbi:MAG: CHAT domain-containing protein [Alphaproteobacteria bacterium]|nr:CHAT domain-containing protein [Alphaproteobacteria bacterium]
MIRFWFPVVAALVVGGCVALQPQKDSFVQQRRFAELEQLMEGQIKDQTKSPTSELFYLCYAYSRLKRYDRLFPCLDRLQANIDRGDRELYWFDFSSAPALMRAEALIDFGDYKKALAEAGRAYAQTKTGAYLLMRIHALSAVGLAHALNGDREQARTYAEELRSISTSYPNNLMSGDKYMGLARIWMALGDHARAVESIREDDANAPFKALSDLVSGASLFGESLFTYWEMPKRTLLYRALLETGDRAAAREGYDSLLAMPQAASSGDLLWLILSDRGRIAEAEGDTAAAVAFYRRAIDEIEVHRSTIKTETGKIGFAGDKQTVYGRMVAALVAAGRVPEAFEYVERAKARSLVDLLAGRRQFAVRGASVAAEEALARLDRAEADMRSVGAGDAGTGGVAGRRNAVEAMKKALHATAPELASLVTVTGASASGIQALLSPGETLVEYYASGSDMYAFVVSREALRAVALDGRDLHGEVARFRAALENPDSPDPVGPARALYARLVAPLGLPEGGRLAIVPHGDLHYVPFAALHSGAGYLIDRHPIRVLPSASVMTFLKGREVRGGRLLALGNPDLGNPEYDLEHAQAEAAAIASLRPDATLLLRGQATETAFKTVGARFPYLHLASHGKFLPDNPLQSGLLLAGDAANDGLLTVGELYSLALDADLVTLSACETALGKVEGGDDVVGFTRGFLYAGASTIVSSLWSVDDRATQDLMVGFYKEMAKSPKAEALRKAQTAVRAHHPHPFFWAAFQLTGNGG